MNDVCKSSSMSIHSWVRQIQMICFLLALLCLTPMPAHSVDDSYHSKSLSPAHLTELRKSVQECLGRVNAARDPETRSVFQEELCKRLVQAEDYDNALNVAAAICNTPSINPERRAAHHFMIAQIYELKMRASPNLELMEQNRQRAAAATQEVIARHYPRRWMVTESAERLLKEINDPKFINETRAWVRKREAGGINQQTAGISTEACAVAAPAPYSKTSVARSGGAITPGGGALTSPIIIDGYSIRRVDRNTVPQSANAPK